MDYLLALDQENTSFKSTLVKIDELVRNVPDTGDDYFLGARI